MDIWWWYMAARIMVAWWWYMAARIMVAWWWYMMKYDAVTA